MLVAIGLFLVWYILSFAGEEMVKSGTLKPLAGMWGSTLLLLPLALFLIRQARNDSPIFRKETYLRLWAMIRNRFVRSPKLPSAGA